MSPTKTKAPQTTPDRELTPAASGGAPAPTLAPTDVGTLPAAASAGDVKTLIPAWMIVSNV